MSVLTASTISPSSGQPVTSSVSVVPGSQGVVPTGTVYLYDNGVLLMSVTLDQMGTNNPATFTTSALSVGSHTISMSFSGDQNFNALNSSLTVTVY